MNRKQMQNLLGFFLFHFTKVEYQGIENIPTKGPLLMVTNHLGRLDIPLLLANPVRPEITAFVAKKYQKFPFFRCIVNSLNGIYLDRTTADFEAFRKAKKVLKSGMALAIAPEGTRSSTGALAEAKSGAAMLAMQLQIPIVPIGLQGTETATSLLRKFRKPKLTARFGKVFYLPSFNKENRETQLKEATTEIMCRIASLLPEKYRGFYSNHPRLIELESAV